MTDRYKSAIDIGPSEEELEENRWPLEIGALWVHELLLRLCAFWWIIDHRESEGESRVWDRVRAIWVMCWLVVLITMWAINPSGALREVFAVLAIWRLLEVSTTALGTVLDRRQQAQARSLITVAIYALQAAFIFAILEHSWAGGSFVSGHTHATQAFDFLYISWTDMTTLGNNAYTATNNIARLLQMLTTAYGLLLFGVMLSLGINRLPREQTQRQASKK